MRPHRTDQQGQRSRCAGPARGYTQGAIFSVHGASITEDPVRPDVTGVMIHAYGRDVQATVRGGRYVDWWPGPAFRDGLY